MFRERRSPMLLELESWRWIPGRLRRAGEISGGSKDLSRGTSLLGHVTRERLEHRAHLWVVGNDVRCYPERLQRARASWAHRGDQGVGTKSRNQLGAQAGFRGNGKKMASLN